MYFGLVLRLFVGGNKFYLYQHAFTWSRLLNTDAMIILIVIREETDLRGLVHFYLAKGVVRRVANRKVEARLQSPSYEAPAFLRVHKSYIVNMNQAKA